MHKIFKSVMAAALLVAPVHYGHAEVYQVELGAAYAYMDEDQSQMSASAQMYFMPVDASNKVLAEAAFLERASSLTVLFGAAELLYDGQTLFEGEQAVDFTYTEFAVDWYSASSGLYLGFSQASFAPDDEDEYADFPDYDNWTAKIGLMPVSGVLIYTQYEDETGYDPNIAVKYVSNIDNGKAINLEAQFIDYDSDDDEVSNSLSVGVDIYLTQFFSVGGTIGQQDDTVYGVRTRYFLNPSFSVGAFAYSGDEVEQFGLTARVRF